MSVAYANETGAALRERRFCVTVEFVTPERPEPLAAAVAPALELGARLRADPRLTGFSVADRLRSEGDHDPALVAHRLAAADGRQPRGQWQRGREEL